MRIITELRIKQAIKKHNQWERGLLLWKKLFKQKEVCFESYQQIKQLWKNTSNWNVDRIAAKDVVDSQFKDNCCDWYIFDIHKNECRLVTRIQGSSQKIFIREILSHTEYDKWCKNKVKS